MNLGDGEKMGKMAQQNESACPQNRGDTRKRQETTTGRERVQKKSWRHVQKARDRNRARARAKKILATCAKGKRARRSESAFTMNLGDTRKKQGPDLGVDDGAQHDVGHGSRRGGWGRGRGRGNPFLLLLLFPGLLRGRLYGITCRLAVVQYTYLE